MSLGGGIAELGNAAARARSQGNDAKTHQGARCLGGIFFFLVVVVVVVSHQNHFFLNPLYSDGKNGWGWHDGNFCHDSK